jgi:hypothetical protein
LDEKMNENLMNNQPTWVKVIGLHQNIGGVFNFFKVIPCQQGIFESQTS